MLDTKLALAGFTLLGIAAALGMVWAIVWQNVGLFIVDGGILAVAIFNVLRIVDILKHGPPPGASPKGSPKIGTAAAGGIRGQRTMSDLGLGAGGTVASARSHGIGGRDGTNANGIIH